jgi:hypothetical protein
MWFDTFFAWLKVGDNALTLAQLAAAFITAIATFALWRVTRVLAVETSELAKMTSRPFVICGLESSLADPTALNLVVRNTGNAAAFDIKTKIKPPLPRAIGETVDGKTETSVDVSYLPPGQVLSRQGVMSQNIYDIQYEVEISWSSSPRSSERENLSYTFEGRDGFSGGFKEKGIHEIASELEKIRKSLAK